MEERFTVGVSSTWKPTHRAANIRWSVLPPGGTTLDFLMFKENCLCPHFPHVLTSGIEDTALVLNLPNAATL